MKKKLTSSQIHAISVLGKYDSIVMSDGWLTGGHGVKLDLRTVNSLRRMGLIQAGKLTELGNSAAKVINEVI